MLKSRICALLLPGAATLSLVTAGFGAPGVDLLSAGPSAVRLGVTAPEPELVAPDSTAAFSAQRVIRLEGWELSPVPGLAALPSRIVRVAVPPTGAVTVRGFGVTAVERDGVTLAPWRGSVDPAAATANDGHLAPERARLVGVSWMRNQRVATVEIFPCDYEPAARRLTSWSRIELEVAFAPSAPTTPAERIDPFESIYQGTLVNYEQGRSWRRSATAPLGAELAARRTASAAVTATSIFVGHSWVKIAIPKSGFYKITYGQLRALAPFAGVDTIGYQRLRLYAWPGRPVLSETVPCDACDYRQVAIAIEDAHGNSGILDDNDDGFSFYAQGPSDWANHYDSSFADDVYIQNPYAAANYYFLSFDGAVHGTHDDDVEHFGDSPARIAANSLNATPQPDGSEQQPTSFRERLHFEQDSGNEYFPSVAAITRPDGREPWAWPKFMWRTVSMGGTFQTVLRTPSPAPDSTAYVRTRIWGTARNLQVDPPLPDCAVNPNHKVDVVLQGSTGYDSLQISFSDFQPPTARSFLLADSLLTLRFRVVLVPGCGERIDQSTLDFSEVYYARRFVPDKDELTFDSPGQGNVIYTIGPFTSDELPRLYDITDPFAPVEMTTDLSSFTATHTIQIEVNESGRRRYAFLPTSHFVKPAPTDFVSASSGSLDDLRSDHVADHIIVYYDAFQVAADSLAAWRHEHLPLASHPAPYDVVKVPVSSIFDQFSGGRTDPVALRMFLRAAWNNWNTGLTRGKPTYVTFFGDASFDFRNLLGLANPGDPGSLLPSFENNQVSGDQYSSDDWLLNKDDDLVVNAAIPDFIGGRIPAGDAASAMDYLRKKLFPQERSAPTGTWRNRVMLVADDDQQGEKDDRNFHWTHVAQTATLDSLHLPAYVDRSYVYLHTYPDGPGRTKPGAKADIKNTINGDGITLFNYIGHGSPFKLSDESVLIDVDAGTFVNASKLPLFVAASCDVGKFNDPRVPSLGERLLFGENGGTIGVISASEIAFSFPNVAFNYALYDHLFDRTPALEPYPEPVGRALLNAKLQTGTNTFNIQNNQKYHLLGDAAIRLHLPQLWVDVEIADETGTTPVTELQAGQTLTCKGQVLDREGGTQVPYSGVVDVLIEDSAPKQITPPCVYVPTCEKATYDFRAGAIFRGSMVVTGGTFSGKFVVPLEAAGGPRGRVRAYVEGFPNQPPQTDGVGSQRLQISPGTAPPGDESGPTVALSFPGGVTSVKPDAVLRIELSDPSGILTTGHTVQNGIIVTVDGNTTARVDVTSSFRYAANSHTTGTATFTLPNLAAGQHTISVSAADNFAGGLTSFQHRSNASITFQVAEAPPISIRNAYLFPNPTESGRRLSGGTFVVDGPGDSANVMVRLFTISGRMIRELKSFGTFGQVQVPWDGLDAEGYPLANGTYLFKVYVNGRDETGKSTARQKAARDGRFVILNH